MKRILKNPLKINQLFNEQGMAGLEFVSMNIGYDKKAYFLFSSKIPERIDGMFVDTVADSEYTALAITPDWKNGTVQKIERFNLGKHKMNFRFIRPLPDDSFLLLGSRCMYLKDGPEKNAVFTDKEGNVLRELTFGDGICDCIVRNDGIIITSYFDEGIFGNYGWEEPIGSCGLIAWTKDGEIIWRSERDIMDCYTINLDEENRLWYYYYDEFILVCTDFNAEKEYNPNIEGAGSFTTVENSSLLIMDGGYDEPDQFYISKFINGEIKDREAFEFTDEQGNTIPLNQVIWAGEKALVLSKDLDICFFDYRESI